MSLRDATAADLDYIEDLQARPDFFAMVAKDRREALEAALTDPARDVLIWERDGARLGFAILVETVESKRVEILRIMLDAPGQGEGAAFMDALLDRAFAGRGCDKIYLDVADDNPRAIRSYARAGFVSEGRLREHWLRRTGDRVDLILMGMLRREWEAARADAASRAGGGADEA